VLVRPYPERVAGDPISYAFDAATQTFTLTHSPDGSRKPTEISVPTRVYPSGYQVDCDCEYHVDGAELVIDSVSGDPATIAIGDGFNLGNLLAPIPRIYTPRWGRSQLRQ